MSPTTWSQSAPAAPPAPVPRPLLEVVGGLVLGGFLLLQAQTYAGLASPGLSNALPGTNAALPLQFGLSLLVQGPSYALASLGLGMALPHGVRCRGAGTFRWGIGGLLALGLVHAWGLGGSDQLPAYALLGGVASFLGGGRRGRLGVGALLLLTLTLGGFPPAGLVPSLTPRTLNAGEGLQSGLRWLTPWLYHLLLVLLGAALSQGGDLSPLIRQRVPLSLGVLVLLPLGLLFQGVQALLGLGLMRLPPPWGDYQPLVQGVAQALGAPILALVYFLEIALHGPTARGWTRPLGWVGRLGLTNYGVQSLLSLGFFTGWRLVFFHPTSPLVWWGAVGAIFALQVGFSYRWRQSHARGPLEGLWHYWTGGHPAPPAVPVEPPPR